MGMGWFQWLGCLTDPHVFGGKQGLGATFRRKNTTSIWTFGDVSKELKAHFATKYIVIYSKTLLGGKVAELLPGVDVLPCHAGTSVTHRRSEAAANTANHHSGFHATCIESFMYPRIVETKYRCCRDGRDTVKETIWGSRRASSVATYFFKEHGFIL